MDTLQSYRVTEFITVQSYRVTEFITVPRFIEREEPASIPPRFAFCVYQLAHHHEAGNPRSCHCSHPLHAG
ncbi:hypothetical protein Y032_0036g3162 [Ancylostoma ceylanicum]|uniref:Uncharacterized protein n=1 Tax=Ancylostoma ceylanicum TaxID=53326 RepID=A0A016UKN7_9BILA|nr:hypothetical protein Y032_0036g3162 [Ancylostoma ceylanicum]